MKNYSITLLVSLFSLTTHAQTLLNTKFVEHGTNVQYTLTITQTGPETALAIVTSANGSQTKFAVNYSKWSQDPLDGAVTIERSHFSGISETGSSLSVYGNNTVLNTRANCYYGYPAVAHLNDVMLDEVPANVIPLCPSEDTPFPGN